MGVTIYVDGEATMDITREQENQILNIKRRGKSVFRIWEDCLYFADSEYEGLTPLDDFIDGPLKEVVKICGNKIEGTFYLSDSSGAYGSCTIQITDGTLFYRNTHLLCVTDEELLDEVKRRGLMKA